MQQAAIDATWDFRSSRFEDQALALMRMTGCAIALCRQELFIAEGDAVEAYMVLEERHGNRECAEQAH